MNRTDPNLTKAIADNIRALREAIDAETLGPQPSIAGQPPDGSPLTLEVLRGIIGKLRKVEFELKPDAPPDSGDIHVPPPAQFSFQATLTPEGEVWRDSLFRPRVNLTEVEPGKKYRQARTHRRRRINKKWRKRYGLAWEPDYYLGDKILWDTRTGNYYCHPPTARRIENELLRKQPTEVYQWKKT